MSPRLINALFALASFMPPACAMVEPVWTVVAPPMEPEWIRTNVETLRAVCREGETALLNRACVVRKFETLMCFIFSVDPPEAFSDEDRKHEEEGHCRKGMNHD